MTELSCADYKAALRAVCIEHALMGGLDMSIAHETQEDTLFKVWTDAITKVMSEGGSRSFKALERESQRAYFDVDSFFRFEKFRDAFLQSARKKEGIVLS